MRRRPSPTLTVVGLVLALAGLMAVAAGGAPLWAPLRGGPVDRLEILIGVGVLFALGLSAAAAVAIILHGAAVARRPGAPPLTTSLLRALPITTAALAVASLLLIARTDLGRGVPQGDEESWTVMESSGRSGRLMGIIDWRGSPVRAGEGVPDEEDPTGTAPEPVTPLAYLFVVMVAFAAAIVVGAAWRWQAARARRTAAGEKNGAAGDPDQERVHGAVIDTIDAMLADPDPNTAIRGAYARLLENLEELGTGRRDHEAPMEHLQRVLRMLHVRPDPLRQLIELFELARFSTHPLKTTHRDRALEALRAVAGDLGRSDVAIRA